MCTKSNSVKTKSCGPGPTKCPTGSWSSTRCRRTKAAAAGSENHGLQDGSVKSLLTAKIAKRICKDRKGDEDSLAIFAVFSQTFAVKVFLSATLCGCEIVPSDAIMSGKSGSYKPFRNLLFVVTSAAYFSLNYERPPPATIRSRELRGFTLKATLPPCSL